MFDSQEDTAAGCTRAADPRIARLEVWRARVRSEADAMVDCSTGMPESLRVTRTAVHDLRGIEWGQMSIETARDITIELEQTRRTLDGIFAAGLAHLDAAGGIESAAGLKVPHWLAYRTHGSGVAAKRLLAAGKTLGRFTRFAAAVDNGELTVDHAVVLHDASNPRIADLLLEAEPTLLELASSCTVEQFRKGLRAIVSRLDADGPEPDCSDRDELAMTTDSTGTVHLRGRFSGTAGVTLREAINDEMTRQLRAAVNERRTGPATPGPTVLRARGFMELIRRGLAIDLDTSRAPRTEAILVIRPGESTCDHHGEPLDPHTAAVLLCDAFLQPIITDSDGTPLFAGRTARFATSAQRRALIVRDGGCIFPGCDAPASWCDAHHVTPWDKNGRTDIDNLALLCRRHHGLAHHNDWSLAAESKDQGSIRYVWTAPNGRTLAAQHAANSEPPDPASRRTAA